jgi:hypothetical protein
MNTIPVKNIDPFTLVLLQNNTDFIIAKNPFCKTCLCNKLSTIILRMFNLTKSETKEIQKLGVRAVNVRCECTKQYLGDFQEYELFSYTIKTQHKR